MPAPARPGYRALLSTPGGARSSAAALVGRMPIAMLGIGSVLLVADRRGSYALAGAVAGAYAIGRAALGPFVSRLVDTRGQARVLPGRARRRTPSPCSRWSGSRAPARPASALLLAGVAVGAALPPLGPCVRTRWSLLLAEAGRQRPAAPGPGAGVGRRRGGLRPRAAARRRARDRRRPGARSCWPSLALGAVGTLAFVALHRDPPRPDRGAPRPASALRVPGVRVVALTLAAVGVAFGALEVVVVVFAEERGAPGSAGWLLAPRRRGQRRRGARVRRPHLARPGGPAAARRARRPGRRRGAAAARAVRARPRAAGAAVRHRHQPDPDRRPSRSSRSSCRPRPTPRATRCSAPACSPASPAGSALGGALAEGAGARTGFAVCLAGAVVALAVAATGRRRLAT